jgi:hypothetical protein
VSNNSSIVACVFVAVVTCFAEPLRNNDMAIFTEPLLSNDRGYTYRHRMIRGIYEARLWDAFRCRNIHVRATFHKVWFKYSEVNTQIHRQHGDRISLL